MKTEHIAGLLSRTQIDEIVYRCRQSGDDSTYDIVNAAIRAVQEQQEPAWFLVTQGRAFVDRAYPSRESAERIVAQRKDGARVVPLFAFPHAAPGGESEQFSKIVVTKDERGCIVAVTRHDMEGRVIDVIAESDKWPDHLDDMESQQAAMYRFLRAGPAPGLDSRTPGIPWVVNVVIEHGVPTTKPISGAALDAAIYQLADRNEQKLKAMKSGSPK
jgi:hypothetical protein